MKKILKVFMCCLICLTFMNGCSSSKNYICDRCGNKFHGTAYTNKRGTATFCKSCATEYWGPIPISEHKY